MVNSAIMDLDGEFSKQAQAVVAGAIQYDSAIRRLVLESGNVSPDMIDFLFGRPLKVTLKAAGFTMKDDL